MLTVMTWLWKQPLCRAQYRSEHVYIWAEMVARHLKKPHRLACVTDETDLPRNVERIEPPREFEDVEPVWGEHKPNCYRRLTMFRRDADKLFGAKRFVCMDLDCVVGDSIDSLFDRDDDLVLLNGTATERPYNGSLMLITAGCRPHVYERFNQRRATKASTLFHGSDQAWLAHCLGKREAKWTQDDGVWFWDNYVRHCKRAKPRILFFPGKQKPWHMKRIFPFIRSNYRITEREAA